MSTIKLLKTSPPSIWSLMARPRPRFSSMTGPTAMQQPPSALPVCLLRPSAKRAPKSRQDPKDRRAAARSLRCGQLEFSRDFAYSGERKSPDVVAATSPPQIGWKIKIRIRWWRRTVYSFEATLSEVHFIVGKSCTYTEISFILRSRFGEVCSCCS